MSLGATPPVPVRQRRDWRLTGILAVVLVIGLLGWLVERLPSRGVEAARIAPPPVNKTVGFDALQASAAAEARSEIEALPEPAGNQTKNPVERQRANTLIKQAAALTRDKKHEETLRVLHAEHPLLKDDPRAYYHLAKALMARGDAAAARDFYQQAIDRDPAMADAYFGYAEAAEAQGDLVGALGGMRTFIHVSKDADPYRLRIAQARSAIWEWEAKLGRGPWGPTKGIPPGFTADEIKRDGRGVGIKMQKIETLRPDGTMENEMKAQKKFKIFERE